MPPRKSKPEKKPTSKNAAAKPAAGMQAAAKALPTIDALRIKGYKSIVDSGVLELGDITLICGPNSAGKSALMQPLLMMKQTVERFSDPGGLWIGGPNVVFQNASEFLTKIDGFTAQSMSVAARVSYGSWLEIEYERKETGAFSPRKSRVQPPSGIPIELNESLSERECDSAFESLWAAGFGSLKKKDGWKSLQVRTESFRQVLAESDSAFPALDPFQDLVRAASTLIHVSGLRDNPKRAYDLTNTGPQLRGLFHEYTASLLDEWGRRTDSHSLIRLLERALEQMGIAYAVKTERFSDTSVAVLVRPRKGRGSSEGWVNICDVGLGVSQVLPVVVAAITSQLQDGICYIEQPEIHLHPNAQYELGKYLGTLASIAGEEKRRSKLIVETHSSILLLGLQEAHVATPFAKVLLHWASLGADGRTTFTSATMDEHGRYGDWPVDFDAVSMRAMQSFWEQLERKASKK